jgi:predicted O-methyltransferase YrrM
MARRFRWSWRLAQLEREDDELLLVVAQAAQDAATGALSDVERRWTDRIETLREDMHRSSESVTRLDFGAGSRGGGRTQEEMDAGVSVTSTLGEISRQVSKPPLWCSLLFHIVRGQKPERCLEMGTAVGVSAAYQAAALALNGHGRLMTLEGAPTLAAIAERNFELLDLDNVVVRVGKFQDTLQDAIGSLSPLDYAFIDGHHDEQATLGYFEQLYGSLARPALLVFDDIAWSEGMKRAWRAICGDARVSAAVDFGSLGVCVVSDTPARRRYHALPLAQAAAFEQGH